MGGGCGPLGPERWSCALFFKLLAGFIIVVDIGASGRLGRTKRPR